MSDCAVNQCGCKVLDYPRRVVRDACGIHSDAALAAKESQYQANMEELRQQRDRATSDCSKQLQAMFDREQIATKSAESLSCMVEQLKVEAGYRIVDSARLREEIVLLRREGIAKDERIVQLEDIINAH